MQKKISFEDAMIKLDDTVRQLESGGLSLDESIRVFEEGIRLIKFCNEKLETAEQKVRLLTENADGSVTDAPFEVLGDET